MSGKTTDRKKPYPNQEWLLDHVEKYRVNYSAVLKHSKDGLQSAQSTLRWLYNSAKREANRVGLLDDEGRIK